VRCGNSAGGTTSSPTKDSGTQTFWPQTNLSRYSRVHGFYLFSNPTGTESYVRIDLTDAANPDGVFKAGRVIVSDGWRPSRNTDYGIQQGFDDGSQKTITMGGEAHVRDIENIPDMDFSISFLDEDEFFNNSFEIARESGSKRSALVIFNPDSANHKHHGLVYGLLDQKPRIIRPTFNMMTQKFHIEGLV